MEGWLLMGGRILYFLKLEGEIKIDMDVNKLIDSRRKDEGDYILKF